MRSFLRLGAAGLALSAGLVGLAGCDAVEQTTGFVDKGVPRGSFGLVAFGSCDDALRGLREAAKSVVGPYGLFTGPGGVFAEGDARRDGAAPPAAAGGQGEGPAPAPNSGTLGSAPNYTGTNTHEAGVDEPDLVKTDGRRIVTVSGGVLRVVDPVARRVTGFVDLTDPAGEGDAARYSSSDLLLFGDHALVLLRQEYYAYDGRVAVPEAPPAVSDQTGQTGQGGAPAPGAAQAPPGVAPTTPPKADQPKPIAPIVGPRLVLVDLAGQPKVLSSLRTDGSLVDARQVGSTVRVVTRSYPRIVFPPQPQGTDAQRTQANKAIIDQAGAQEWLPRIELSVGRSTRQSVTSCDAISRPSVYTGSNLLTILSFDLGTNSLGDGSPTTIVADGDTVYSDGNALYVASDQRWRALPQADGKVAKPTDPQTAIYKFDTPATAARPSFVAGGGVAGYLINQYALSAWEGRLRVATTTGEPWAAPGVAPSQSSVYVLAQDKGSLKQVGHVGGLGKGERIYAVRFVGPIGYVVTFRQTDPLYTVDLRDPAHPTVRGELKIAGYSAYLHPVPPDRLIGIGQDANAQGQVRGTQVSLFTVADLAKPNRLARHTVSGAHSEAEFDPHAFLYQPSSGLLVVPLQVYGGVTPVPRPGPVPPTAGPDKVLPTVGALVLHISDSDIVELGFITHPSPWNNPGYPAQIRRSLIIGETIWTVSDGGLLATNARTVAAESWIPFS